MVFTFRLEYTEIGVPESYRVLVLSFRTIVQSRFRIYVPQLLKNSYQIARRLSQLQVIDRWSVHTPEHIADRILKPFNAVTTIRHRDE